MHKLFSLCHSISVFDKLPEQQLFIISNKSDFNLGKIV